MDEQIIELETAIDKWDNDQIDLDPDYVEPIMDGARNWLEHLKDKSAVSSRA